MRQFPGPAIHFLMQIVMLLPAAGLLSWQGGRCCLEALSLNSAAGNGKIQRVLAITYSVPEFVLLFLFFFSQYLILKSAWENTGDDRYKPVASRSKKPNSHFSMQCEKFSKSNFVKNQIRFCGNTACSTNYMIWFHLIMKRLIIPDNGLMYFLMLPVLHSCYTLPMSTGTLSVMI